MSAKKKVGLLTVTPSVGCEDCGGEIPVGPEQGVADVYVEDTPDGPIMSMEPVSGGSSSVGGRARYRSQYDQIKWRGKN